MKKLATLLLFFISLLSICPAQVSHILPMRERATVIDRWIEDRIQTVLPQLMRREGIDMWILIAREYNEDPVVKTMLPATWLSARRRTILVIFDPGSDKPLETLAIARYDVGKSFQKAWDKESQPDQWAALREIIESRNPRQIAINRSDFFATADGLTSTEYQAFMGVLPEGLHDKVISGEKLSIGWLETRTEQEMQVYQQICRIAHEIIAEGFSEQVIQPGITTTDDVIWWYRERIRELKLQAWFHPSVAVQRADPEDSESQRSFSQRPEKNIILPGDLLHVDFGITYLRLNTDTQWHAYVLKPGEREAPLYLQEAFATGNRLQDILTDAFKTGRTGNEILAEARKNALEEGITPSIYTHPIGFHGHGAGPTIGLWDQQGGVPVKGDYPLYPNTAYSIELNATISLEEWNKDIRIMLEEEAFFDGESVRYIDGRQVELITIPRMYPELR
ncbi:MAG: M24 family metallopeptidase [Bacteroidota bacterium]